MDLTSIFNEGELYYTQYGEIDIGELRKKHPMWRAGYNTAMTKVQQQHDSVPKVLYKIEPIDVTGVELTWNQIVGITKKPRYDRLHEVPELYPILSAILHKAFENRSRLRNYVAMSAYVGLLFDAVLEYGLEVGELTPQDLQFNGYRT